MMDKNQARFLWSDLCLKTVGGNETEAYDQTQPLGLIATSHGLPHRIYGSTLKVDAAKVADFLEAWAKALRDN